MITPEWYTYEFDLLKTHKALQEEILRDIARRIATTDMNITETAAWQAEMAQKSGILYDDLIKEIAKRTGGTTAEIRQIFKDAKVEVFNYDNDMLLENGQDPEIIKHISPKMQNAMKSALTKTSTEAKNLTKTTAITSQSAYLQACDLAHQKLVSGAFSYQSAIKTAVKFAAGQGVKVIYPSGHISSLDVAIRRSVLTGVNQTAGNLQNMRADELDCDIMELSAHSGARPTHAAWQGQLVSRSGAKGYLSLDDIGYGEVTGFMGANCRHNWYMYFGGMRMYTPEELSKINNRTVTYNDTEYTEYDALQVQRKFERDIHKYKTELVMYDEAMKNIDGDVSELKTEFNFTARKLKAKESELKDFCKQTELRRDRYREQVFAVDTEKKIANFGRSTSSKAVWANKKALTNGGNGGIIELKGVKTVQSGAFYGALNPENDKDFKRCEEHAQRYYEEIRKRTSDIEAIAHNTNLPQEQIQCIKAHIFTNKYDLGEDEPTTFYPNYDISVSWQNLIDGHNISEKDIILLNHEYYEYKLMMDEGLSYVEAHSRAQEKYNYKKAVDEWRAKK